MKINNCPYCGAVMIKKAGSSSIWFLCVNSECYLESPISGTYDGAAEKLNSLRGPASEPEQKPEQMNVRLQVAAMIVAETYRHTSQRVELVAPSIFKEVDALIKAERETREVVK